jgi:hypothetical protein
MAQKNTSEWEWKRLISFCDEDMCAQLEEEDCLLVQEWLHDSFSAGVVLASVLESKKASMTHDKNEKTTKLIAE